MPVKVVVVVFKFAGHRDTRKTGHRETGRNRQNCYKNNNYNVS